MIVVPDSPAPIPTDSVLPGGDATRALDSEATANRPGTSSGSSSEPPEKKIKLVQLDTDSDGEVDEESKADVNNLVCNICLVNLENEFKNDANNTEKLWVEFPCCRFKTHGTCLVSYYLNNQGNITGNRCPICRQVIKVLPSYAFQSFSESHFPNHLFIYLPASVFIHHHKTELIKKNKKHKLGIKELLKMLDNHL